MITIRRTAKPILLSYPSFYTFSYNNFTEKKCIHGIFLDTIYRSLYPICVDPPTIHEKFFFKCFLYFEVHICRRVLTRSPWPSFTPLLRGITAHFESTSYPDTIKLTEMLHTLFRQVSDTDNSQKIIWSLRYPLWTALQTIYLNVLSYIFVWGYRDRTAPRTVLVYWVICLYMSSHVCRGRARVAEWEFE